ncbi:hypothetical protein [Actinophytocola oryzae]|nr:hypothetical protein [Actinophytocola oryzae]
MLDGGFSADVKVRLGLSVVLGICVVLDAKFGRRVPTRADAAS